MYKKNFKKLKSCEALRRWSPGLWLKSTRVCVVVRRRGGGSVCQPQVHQDGDSTGEQNEREPPHGRRPSFSRSSLQLWRRGASSSLPEPLRVCASFQLRSAPQLSAGLSPPPHVCLRCEERTANGRRGALSRCTLGDGVWRSLANRNRLSHLGGTIQYKYTNG